MRLIDNQQGAVFARERTHTVEVARLRQHNADVCQSGLDEHGRDIAVGELAFEHLKVVELGNPARFGHVNG